MDLKKKVRDKISELGIAGAQEFFGVSAGTVSNWGSGKTPPSIEAAELVLDDTAIIPSQGLVNWEGRQVMIGLPVYRTFNAETHFTLFANYAKFGPDKIAMEIVKQTLIYEARNMLVDKMLKNPSIKRLVMVDDDMALPFGNANYFNGNLRAALPIEKAGQIALNRLLSHGEDKGIVGCLYFGRHEAGRAQCASGFTSDIENARLHQNYYQGLKKEEWVGTGFIKIERWVFEKMKIEIDKDRWPGIKRKKPDLWDGYFTPVAVGIGEDVSFCARARDIGIQSYVDASLECLHMGDRPYGSSNTTFRT